MRWRAIYFINGSFQEYTSEGSEWVDLPQIGIQRVYLIFPSGAAMVISGWDYYVIRVQDGQAEAIYWKDENAVDPNGDPMFDEYAGMFSRRVFRDDQTATPTEYRPNDELPAIEENEIKHGRWITEEFAKQIRVL